MLIRLHLIRLHRSKLFLMLLSPYFHSSNSNAISACHSIHRNSSKPNGLFVTNAFTRLGGRIGTTKQQEADITGRHAYHVVIERTEAL